MAVRTSGPLLPAVDDDLLAWMREGRAVLVYTTRERGARLIDRLVPHLAEGERATRGHGHQGVRQAGGQGRIQVAHHPDGVRGMTADVVALAHPPSEALLRVLMPCLVERDGALVLLDPNPQAKGTEA